MKCNEFDEKQLETRQQEKLVKTKLPVDENEISEKLNLEAMEDQEESSEEVVLRWSSRERRPPDRYGARVNTAQTDYEPEPSNFEEASKSLEKQKWKEAMEKEIDSLNTNEIYDFVELPKARKAMVSKWVYKCKINADGSVGRYNASLVAQGYSQRPALLKMGLYGTP